MSDYYEFEGRVEPLEWGTSVYTILRLPADVSAALEGEGARRVEGEINDHSVNMAMTKAPVIDGVFLYAGKAFLKEIGAEPGEELYIRLRKADPDQVDVPDDLILALRQAEMTDRWAALTPGKQRGLLHTVNTAKRADTRAKRIAKLITELP